MNIKDILTPGERVLGQGKQKRMVPGGKEWAPGSFYVTTERIILQTNSLMGLRKDFEDLHYSDVLGIHLHKGLLSAELKIRSRFQGDIELGGIDKGRVQEIQRIITEGTNRYRYGYGGPRYDQEPEKRGGWLRRK